MGTSTSSRDIPPLSLDALTPYFDRLVGMIGYGDRLKAMALAGAVIRDGEHILDVGAGTGSLVLLAKKTYPHARIVGVEPDTRTLAIARAKVEQSHLAVELLQADAQQLPFDLQSFDVVMSTLVFHHLLTAVKKQALGEIYRVLKDDGRFLLADFGKAESLRGKVANSVMRVIRLPEAKTLQDNIHGRVPGFLEEAGFRIREVHQPYRGIHFMLATKTS